MKHARLCMRCVCACVCVCVCVCCERATNTQDCVCHVCVCRVVPCVITHKENGTCVYVSREGVQSWGAVLNTVQLVNVLHMEARAPPVLQQACVVERVQVVHCGVERRIQWRLQHTREEAAARQLQQACGLAKHSRCKAVQRKHQGRSWPCARRSGVDARGVMGSQHAPPTVDERPLPRWLWRWLQCCRRLPDLQRPRNAVITKPHRIVVYSGHTV